MSKLNSTRVITGDVSMESRKIMEKLEKYGKRPASLKSLLELYEVDADCFFELATGSVEQSAPGWARSLAELAKQVRVTVREGFDVKSNGNGQVQIVGRSHTHTVPKADANQIIEFFNRLNGTGVGRNPAKDYEGRAISEAEVRFKLGAIAERQSASERVTEWMHNDPEVLKIDEQDKRAVSGGMPGYVVHNLIYCASKIVQAPTVVFRGLRTEGGLRNGRAYCGVPRWAFDNNGTRIQRPANMCFVVYVDTEGFVFDWDWVKEGEKQGYPEGWKDRFDAKVDAIPDATLTGLEGIRPSEFTPSRAWFSRRGDCIFWYKSDTLAYAIRINDELTAFKSFDGGNVVGCKLKNVALIAEAVRNELAKIMTQLMTQPTTDLKVFLSGSLLRQTLRGGATSGKEYATYKTLLGELAGGLDVATQNVFAIDPTSNADLPF